MYENCEQNKISYDIFKRGINLPSYFEMNQDDVSYVVSKIREAGYLKEK